MNVSVILPAHNEADKLETAVRKLKEELERLNYGYEIIIVEDGSTDGTFGIAARLSENHPEVRHLHFSERLGKGRAIEEGIKAASHPIVTYLDADLSMDLKHLKELVEAVNKGSHIAIASRLLKQSKAKRPLTRDIPSRIYNLLVRIILGSKIRDHQCGFKAFKRDAVMDILKDIKDNHWFWDTELLILAQRKGLSIKEIPVSWEQGEDTKVSVGRDSVYMLSRIIRMYGELKNGAYGEVGSETGEGKKGKRLILLSVLTALLILSATALYAGIGNLIDAISRANTRYILYAVILYSSTFLLRGFRYRMILEKLGFPSALLFAAESVAISQTMNVVTPVRIGDAARAYVFKRNGVPYTSSFSALAAERIYDLAAVVLISFVSLFALTWVAEGRISTSAPYYGLAFLIFIIAAVYAASRLQNVVGDIFRSASELMKGRTSPVVFVLSLLIWTVDILVCQLVLTALSAPAPLALTALAVSAGNLAKILPITPGGIGTYEASLTAILSFSVSVPSAFAAALIDHAIKNLVTVALGIASSARLGLKLSEVRRAGN